MATVIDGLHGSTGFHIGAKLRATGARFAAYRAQRRDRARILRDLQFCDDRELRDMNISRYDFQAIADGSFKP
jgi:uncharacterized protein YjiS (DUF1127 family)